MLAKNVELPKMWHTVTSCRKQRVEVDEPTLRFGSYDHKSIAETVEPEYSSELVLSKVGSVADFNLLLSMPLCPGTTGAGTENELAWVPVSSCSTSYLR